MLFAQLSGGAAAGLWRATSCAAASRTQAKERRMATSNGHREGDRGDNTATERLAAKGHETIDVIAERAERTERELRGVAAKTVDQARRLQEEATARAEQSLHRADSYLHSNPLPFVGLAFAAGVLLSTLLRR
jgi:ElaB/YqjD/DUF883 family membrane-anchored ribosome-binding protein